LFFRVRHNSGLLHTGHDPERDAQIIHEVRFMAYSEILALPPHTRHGIFQYAHNIEDLFSLRGYFRAKK
jgi:hypothetical protein